MLWLWQLAAISYSLFSFYEGCLKDHCKTSVAAVVIFNVVSIAALILQSNSVFTAQALVIQITLLFLPFTHSYSLFLTNVLSAISAIACTFHSNKIILQPLNTIHCFNIKEFSIHIVWYPGQKGISPNDKGRVGRALSSRSVGPGLGLTNTV